jgi:hypothetical protein
MTSAAGPPAPLTPSGPVSLDAMATAQRVYNSVFEATGSKAKATEAVLDSMDRDLLDPSHEIRHGDGTIIVKQEGLSGEYFLFLHNDYLQSLVETKPRKPLDEEEVNAFVESIAKVLEGRVDGTWMVVLSTGRAVFSGGAVKRALDQIESAEQGRPSEGPLPEREVERILRMRGGVQK